MVLRNKRSKNEASPKRRLKPPPPPLAPSPFSTATALDNDGQLLFRQDAILLSLGGRGILLMKAYLPLSHNGTSCLWKLTG